MEKIDMGINSACVSAGIYDCTNNGPEQKSANNENQVNEIKVFTSVLLFTLEFVFERLYYLF